jgi:hypothetical protein
VAVGADALDSIGHENFRGCFCDARLVLSKARELIVSRFIPCNFRDSSRNMPSPGAGTGCRPVGIRERTFRTRKLRICPFSGHAGLVGDVCCSGQTRSSGPTIKTTRMTRNEVQNGRPARSYRAVSPKLIGFTVPLSSRRSMTSG